MPQLRESERAAGQPSLRGGLLLRLTGMMLVLLVLDAVASYLTAVHFANEVHDRWLIDSTKSLVQEVRGSHGQAQFHLPSVALEIFQFDELDKIFYQVSSRQQGYIDGLREIPLGPPVPPGTLVLTDTQVKGEPVRLARAGVSIGAADNPVTVAVAETLHKRATLAREVLLGMVPAQVPLLAIAGLLAWLGVSRGLKPLTDLAAQIQARDQNNLAPLPLTGLPHETRVLAGRINELLQRLSYSLQSQRRFVADAAHQLRTPLAAVLLQAAAAERAPDPGAARTALVALHRSVERAARLSQQLLSLARTDPEAAVGRAMQPVDLVALARRVGEDWIPQALERDVDFGLTVPAGAVRVQGDERLLAELLSNLIDNALRYGVSRQGEGTSGHVTLVVEATPSPGLSVQDDGPGIPEGERARIFERFYRLPQASDEGCGLGLAIVAEIAQAHQAVVEVGAGHEGRGSRFTVRFPALLKETAGN